MRNKPFDEVMSSIAEGRAVPSVAYSLVRQLQGEKPDLDLTPEQDVLARNVTAVAYAGAASTTTAAAESFVLAMAMFPEVQRRAQEELDKHVGSSRLPDFNDLKSLTYIKAVVMETLRWMPSAPLGLPHCLTEDDVYKGYHIPRGAMIIANVWAMLHNPEDYPDSETFKPERYLTENGAINPSVRDPCTIAFGFGRRACPGTDYAISLLTMYIASVVHVFDIQPGVDEAGQPVQLSSHGSSDAISCPVTFPRHIRPRSKQAEQLIREVDVSYDN
ncbi:hypothetical protein EIP91_011905 [Steccherinum ochraceum]|uniref:O-methylsterigmatocystin oxidoreductase n=1 Tax=Steccherinum ochraceum TaxID=92696 RepID=A0A4R0RLJ2_9APHY|nr:hypothetical protein EIP91_011905 [Steccherinum ochraceum]